MAFTNQQVIDYLLANPGLTDPQIVDAMKQFAITPAQLASAVGLSEGAILSRIAATIPYGSTLTLGDMIIAPEYRIIGSGEDQQIGGLEGFYTSKTTGDPNYKAPVGSEYQQYAADGTFQRTGKTQKTADSFLGGLAEALKDPVVLAALAAVTAGSSGLFSGGGAATSTTGLSLAELGGTAGAGALTAAESAALYGTGGSLTTGLTAAQIAAAEAALPTSTGLLSGGSLTTGLTVADIAAAETGLTTGATTGALTGATTAATTGATTGATTAATTGATTAATTGATTAATTAATAAATGLTTTQVADLVKTGLTTAQIANLFSAGATTASGLLQQQTSKEAADKARAMIDTETAAAKASAQFRPIGMTTRFGTSQFQRDPVTGQLTSAGYTLSPEAKNAQDRFLTLAGQGLTQAEGAQAQFAPLQTGAQRLFGLGNQYLAQTPQDVAQNYLNQQMALLQPGRETELANLQNRLQQQGRGGLSVAQGGTLGATTPELQALFNARAQQEAQLAANAQQFGQQQVAFGAGLLGTGAQTMGQYYGGQQAAYAPYTTAFGQMQALEAAGQQPLQLGVNLGQTAAQAGANVGQLGLRGAEQSVALATGRAATTNPYSTLLGGVGSSDAFGQYVGGLFGSTPQASLTAGFTPAQIAATEAAYPSLFL